jgi:hypothetical protein
MRCIKRGADREEAAAEKGQRKMSAKNEEGRIMGWKG